MILHCHGYSCFNVCYDIALKVVDDVVRGKMEDLRCEGEGVRGKMEYGGLCGRW